ncbi:MAG TPA: hypothetical protein VH325_17715 [Bryobacteraceae bacterium]|jgi:hypothetical protein|nr:hypothetical protein [Bryobacteraceae bacterium]
MRRACFIFGAIAVLALALKLFTFEYFLRDDATSGIAMRAIPSLTNHQVLQHSPQRSLILVEDENDAPGAGAYRAATGWGLPILITGWLILFVAVKRNRRRV